MTDTPLHPGAERQARLAKYTNVESKTMGVLRQRIQMGLISVPEARAALYGL